MKKIFTSIALFGLLAVGCTKSDNVLDNGPEAPGANVETTTSYLTMNLVTPGGVGTRAYDPETGRYEDDKDFEPGENAETKVEDIRFYFFDKDGNPAGVRRNPANPGAVFSDGKHYDSFYDFNKKIDNMQDGLSPDDDDLAIEQKVTLTLQLSLPEEVKDGEKTGNFVEPEYVVAIINPTPAALINNPKLSDLAAIFSDFDPNSANNPYIKDCATTEDGKNHDHTPNKPNTTCDNGSFVMSNSVYMEKVSNEPTKINWTKLAVVEKRDDQNNVKETHTVYQSIDEAEANKTTIFVERVVARLDLTVGKSTSTDIEHKLTPASSENGYNGTDTKNVFFTGKYYKKYNQTEAQKQPIFVKFHGWTVVSTPKKSNLLKDINPNWATNMFADNDAEPWNALDYHRSFWGINPTMSYANKGNLDDNDYYFRSYNYIKDLDNFTNTAEAGRIYIQENAAESTTNNFVAENHASKVIVAAELIDSEGEPMKIVEYGLMYYDKDDLLQYFADQLGQHLYTKAAGSDTKTYITKNDLVYETHAKHYKDGDTEEAGADVRGSYFAYVTMTGDAAAKTWYRDIPTPNDSGELENVPTELKAKDVKDFIDGVVSNRLLIWENGMTYYYFPIRHLGKTAPTITDQETSEEEYATGSAGYYGVVRNHIYKADISGLFGLGTPVLDPNETIYPEKPKHDDYVLATEIKVLQWRVVSQDYEFSW